MSEGLDAIQRVAEREGERLSPNTRRQFVGGAAAALGGMGLIGVLPGSALAHRHPAMGGGGNDVQTVLNIAATAEVLATIVNTVGYRRRLVDDAVTQRNLGAAAQEELRTTRSSSASGPCPRPSGSGCRTPCSRTARTCSTRWWSATRSSSTPT